MAYITTEQVKEIRNKIKQEFPTKNGWKFSIRREHYTALRVNILESPMDLERLLDRKGTGSNIGYNSEKIHEIKKISDIMNNGNHDNSDAMTDYFDVGWYTFLELGHWEKGFKHNNVYEYYKQTGKCKPCSIYRMKHEIYNDNTPYKSIQRWNWDFKNWNGHIHTPNITRDLIKEGILITPITEKEALKLIR